jgi:hypothetical protein
MLFIPFHEHEKRRTVLAVVIETDNLERMKAADPITIESDSRGGLMPHLPYPDNTSLLIAFESDTAPILELARKQNVIGLFQYLERGFQFKQDIDGRHRSIHIRE